eukprot:7454957-Pyramimonas_sp.AAC.1
MPLLMTPGKQQPLHWRLLRRADRLGLRRRVRYLTAALRPRCSCRLPLLMRALLDTIHWRTGESLLGLLVTWSVSLMTWARSFSTSSRISLVRSVATSASPSNLSCASTWPPWEVGCNVTCCRY